MRKLLMALALLALAAPALANFNLNLLVGTKSLDSSDWEPVEDQGLMGIHFDGTPAGWPAAFSVDLIATGEEKTIYYEAMGSTFKMNVTGTTTEYDIGLRRYFGDVKTLSAFVGGGLAMISAEGKVTDELYGKASDQDSAPGVWLNVGVMGRPFEHLNLGVDLRWSKAKVTLFDTSTDAGGLVVAFFVGYGF